MMMKNCKHNTDCGLLLIRLVLGVVFVAHGVMKFQAMPQIIGFFGSLGFPPAVAYLVAFVETFGGLAMLLGMFTDVAGVLLAVTMLVAIVKVKFSHGLVGGYEFELVLLVVALAIACAGPGRYAVMKHHSQPQQ